MSHSVLCKKCGEQVTVPDSQGRPRKVRCPECDTLCETPETAITPQPARGSAPRPDVPDLRIDTTFDDDDRPYPLPADPDQKEPCPHCRKPVPRGTIVCNHCGFHREKGTLLERTYKKVAREWQAGLATSIRVGVFLTLAAITLTTAIYFAVTQGQTVALMLTWFAGVLLLSFLWGTFPRLKLTRSKKGQVRLMQTWRICFVPWKPAEIDWREYEGVSVYPHHKTDNSDHFMLLLLLFLGVIPGIVWWLLIIFPDQYDVHLTRDHGSPALLLHRGRSEHRAREIADSIRNVTDLR